MTRRFLSVKVQPGDTISGICLKMFPNLSKSDRRERWKMFYRQKSVRGKATLNKIPVKNPNQIFAGETLFYPLSLGGEPISGGKSPNRATISLSGNAHGVSGTKPVQLSKSEASQVKIDMDRARTYLRNAIASLEGKNPAVNALFKAVFSELAPRPDVIKNYKKMLASSATVEIFKERNYLGVWAYAKYQTAITVWDTGFFGYQDDSGLKQMSAEYRACTLIHELAHYALPNSGHSVEGKGTVLNFDYRVCADILEEYACRVNGINYEVGW